MELPVKSKHNSVTRTKVGFAMWYVVWYSWVSKVRVASSSSLFVWVAPFFHCCLNITLLQASVFAVSLPVSQGPVTLQSYYPSSNERHNCQHFVMNKKEEVWASKAWAILEGSGRMLPREILKSSFPAIAFPSLSGCFWAQVLSFCETQTLFQLLCCILQASEWEKGGSIEHPLTTTTHSLRSVTGLSIHLVIDANSFTW